MLLTQFRKNISSCASFSQALTEPVLLFRYSCGQTKSTKKNLLLIPLKTTGIDRITLKELPGQLSAHPIKVITFNLPFKESVPKNSGRTLKISDKIMKNRAVTFFFEEWDNPKVW